ncbi:Tubulin/FtsZ, GTPase domain [Pseudocohnilembus persalinus]|uniref:Tubulin delta chain n=1 Tax=Pseudocohnilembus persalinus TaxID=266149 RepID=A0A0V0Q9P2_PSEPJ|nr:Tubulin/FtsZ, GTPase domain [Pseudocohnilembus persalinus]|eukprot:KRW98947.1 Tubulin/FtsZ, GTPase domain [Pseudocohnilembus persalinus]
MSIITLQIGQCGNQLGNTFYSNLNQEILQSSEAHQAIAYDTFFMQSEKEKQLTPKSILIDMEPKVVDKCLNQKLYSTDQYKYDKQFSFVNQEGSGNNWSYGYNKHGEQSKENIIELVRKMLEQVDFCQGFIIMQSMAGGTGSGLGSCIVKQLNDFFDEIPRINFCIMPHQSGEVILQCYNSVLTMTSLYENSDGILLFENDYIQKICNKQLKIKSPSLDDMNKVIANQLTSLLFPVISQNKQVHSSLQNKFQIIEDIQENLLLNPKYKIMSLSNIPQMPNQSMGFNNDQWSSLDKRLFQMGITNSTEDQVNWNINPSSQNALKSFGNLVIVRGEDYNKYEIEKSQFLDKRIYRNERVICKYFFDSHYFNSYHRTIACLSNSQQCLQSLNSIANRSHTMFQENAYLYQYYQHGMEKEDFLQSQGMFEQIIQNYSF